MGFTVYYDGSLRNTHPLIIEKPMYVSLESLLTRFLSCCLDCSQSPIFSSDCLDILRLTITAILIFKCTEGAGVADYGSGGRGGRKIKGLQLAFTERVVPPTQAFDWSLDNRC